MKKLFTLSLMLCLALSIRAQVTNKVVGTEPEFLPEFNLEDVNVTGVSTDGRFIYGMNQSGSAAIYDFQKTTEPMTLIEATPEDYFGVSIAGFDPQGRALVSHYTKSYFLNLEDGSVEYIESPDKNYGLDAWCISADGKYIGCNLTTEDFYVIPMLAEKQEDGKYKVMYLDFDENDAMGCVAQYTQVRYVSDDGSYVMGIQPDNRGMCGRLVVWERQEDGSYKFTTPMDEFLYDFSIEKPGLAPEWDDFVTADPEADPELFDKQSAEFDAAFIHYEETYTKFTRNLTSLEIYMMSKATRSNTICMAYYNVTSEGETIMLPAFYNCDEKKLSTFEDLQNSFGFGVLPEGGFIVATDKGGIYSLSAIDKDDNIKPFEVWFKEKTDVDLTKDFTFTYFDYMTEEEVSGVFPGLPYFSNDGQTLVFTGMDPDNGTFAAAVKFESDIFSTDTGIDNNTAEEIAVKDNKIILGGDRQGVAEVYTLSGAKCGAYTVNGAFDFNTVLSKGAYIVKMNVAGLEPISIKIIVK